MANGDVKIAAARQEQSKSDKANLLDRIRNKTRKRMELQVPLDGEVVTFVFEAISAQELDKLRAKHPPTKQQLADGQGVNITTFNPALVAATLAEPQRITEDEAKELFSLDNWSSGELAQIFDIAAAVCLQGFDIPRNASA
jgi:hypothetical protein